jgi:beta-carotene 3-hydroxylase
MTLALNVAGFLIGLLGMEAVAWATHRWVMHGFAWRWHKGHHEPRKGLFELNDLFAFVFAGIAIGLFAVGALPGWSPVWWAGAGATAYGVLYALFHDALVHNRWGWNLQPRGRYLRSIVQAHHLHHAAEEKDDAVSFGFLRPVNTPQLAAQFRANRARRR